MFVNQLFQGGLRALINFDSTLFDNMTLPKDEDENEVASIQDIVDTILYKFGDAPLFTPDPAVLKYYITLWSQRRVAVWERFYKAINLEYNPINNYDRTEDSTDEFSPGAAYEQLISADNSSVYQPDRKSQGSGKDTRTFKSNISGNIGVTTSQQMLNQELDILPRLDLLNFIADDWHSEFNLFVYN